MNKELTLTNARKIRRLEEITPYVLECRASGKSCKEWCKENNIPVTTYYGWQRRVFEAAKNNAALEFTELTAPAEEPANPSSSGVVARLTFGTVSVDIYSGIDSNTMTSIIRGLQNA